MQINQASQTNQIKIRLAVPDDIEQIRRLNEEFWQYNAALMPYYFQAGHDSGEYPQNMINGVSSDLIVATDGGAIVGLACLMEDKTMPYSAIVQHKFTHVNDLYIIQSHRGKGIGKMLMNVVKEWSKARGHDYIDLTVLEGNSRALEFYLDFGFEVTERILKYRL